MSREVFDRALGIALGNGIPALSFFGGEPLLNPLALPMMTEALESELSLILATNCRPLADERLFRAFADATRGHADRVKVVTARDRFHLRFFDPTEVAGRLRGEGYEVRVQDYSDRIIALSERNSTNPALCELDTSWSCCGARWTDYLGVLPEGAWTLCPPSLEGFGSVFTESLGEMLEFKLGLSFHSESGCTGCLPGFKAFRKAFEDHMSRKTAGGGEPPPEKAWSGP